MAAPDEKGKVESSLTQERRYIGEGGESVVGCVVPWCNVTFTHGNLP